MSLKTNLNRSPYWDDYDSYKNYYRMLFKPSVSVQARELNQLQSILQNQIEKFGDNIFTQGTILSGCNFQFYGLYPYIKLPDTQLDGTPVIPENYVGKFVIDDISRAKAYIINYQDGYELSDPDLKTLYLKYIDSGTNSNTSLFPAGNNVTIYDGAYPIDNIEVVSGALGFSNTDQLIITPTLLLNVASGTIANTDYLINPTTGANVQVLTVDTSTYTGKTLITVKPRDVDLTNSSVNSAAWSMTLYDVVTNQGGTVAATIEQVFGRDAQARITTNSIGTITDVSVTSGGKGYIKAPTATVKTSNTIATIGGLSLDAKNFTAQIKISAVTNAVGNGYAFGVTEGVIYQRGFFLRVIPQTVIISKYNPSPNNVIVAFDTAEAIVTATEDETLYENVLGSPNEFAPGADRLKLSPNLVVLTKEEAAVNTEVFTLVEWNDGKPYKQNQVTQYSRLGDAMGGLIYDSSGNFVLDAFQVTTESVANTSNEGKYYTAVVDPGQAYINGRKVQTSSNYKIDMTKGLDTTTSNNVISINYGNYVRVSQFVGNFDFSGTGNNVSFYTEPVSYVSNSTLVTTGTITPQGTMIGTARIRSIELESGYPGTASAVYRLYLFDTQMNAGKNFRDIKSVYYAGASYNGVADVVLEYSASISANVAVLKNTNQNSLLFDAGVDSVKNSNNTTYIYRTSESVNTTIASASISITLIDPDEYFPYTGDLAGSQMQELLVVPVQDNLECTNATGTVTGNTSVNVITGAATSFTTDYAIGDYIHITDYNTNTAIRYIVGVSNSTSLQVDAPLPFTDTGLYHKRAFPKNLAIPFGQRTGLYANVDGTGKTLTIEFRHSNSDIMVLSYGTAVLVTEVGYNVQRRNVSAATKTANRNKYVKIALANTNPGIDGPWCLGVPDIFRLRAVHLGDSTVNANSTDITQHFYIDHNQNANFLGLGYLYQKPRSTLTLTTEHYLLCVFDYFSRDNAGYYDTVSYLRTANTVDIATLDSLSFANLSLSSAASSWEVPETITAEGKYYDLLKTFDFRPTAANTVAPASTAATAPINPSNVVTFAAHSKFPRPNATLQTQVEQYLGRIDDIYISSAGNIFIQKGIPSPNSRNRYQSNHPKDALRLQTLVVPAYPNICKTVGSSLKSILYTNIGNETHLNNRFKKHSIEILLSTINLQTSQPMVYTMEDIARMERRIADVEYYVNLNMLETSISRRMIPSSIDPALNRFKFGFFADDFSSTTYSDTDNPQYNASLEVEGDFEFGTGEDPSSNDGIGTSLTDPSVTKLKLTTRLVAPKRNWSLKHFTKNAYYVDEAIIKQTNATETVNPCVVDIANTDDTIIGNTYYTGVNRNLSTIYYENLPGAVTIYFDIMPGRDGNGGGLTVYDANGAVIASTNKTLNSHKQLTTNDITFLTTNPLANNFLNAAVVSNLENSYVRNNIAIVSDFGVGSGKIQFPSQGSKVFIKSVSLDPVTNVKYLVEFPSLYSHDRVIVNTPDCDPNPPSFGGSMEPAPLTVVTWACSNLFRSTAAGYKAFVLNLTGLKPNTFHELYLDSVPWQYKILLHPGQVASYNWQLFSINGQLMSFDPTLIYDDNTGPATLLYSDKQGKMTFLVLFPLDIAGWFSQNLDALGYNLDTSSYAALYDKGTYYKDTYGSSGYTTLIVQDASEQSRAIRVFANRTPNKTIPFDPRGNI